MYQIFLLIQTIADVNNMFFLQKIDVLLQSYQVISKLFDGFVFKLDTGTLHINSTGTKSLPQVYTSR